MTAILMDGDPLLRKVSEPVTDFGDELQVLCRRMKGILTEHGGRGLSAVQIGALKRVLLIRERGQPDLIMVNPELMRISNRFVEEREGCLSIPSFRWGNVFRPAKCDASWFSLDGTQERATLTGETARIFQHEFDHLNGVLMTDHMTL